MESNGNIKSVNGYSTGIHSTRTGKMLDMNKSKMNCNRRGKKGIDRRQGLVRRRFWFFNQVVLLWRRWGNKRRER